NRRDQPVRRSPTPTRPIFAGLRPVARCVRVDDLYEGGSVGIEQRDDYAYTGLHAYALVHDVTATTQDPDRNAAGFIRQLQDMAQPEGPVTAAVELAGTFKGLVHLRFGDGDVNAVQDHLATALWDGVTHELAYEGPVYMG